MDITIWRRTLEDNQLESRGLEIRQGEGLSRVQLGCSHQKGLLYVVPAERSWVCSQEMMPAHASGGVFGGVD